MTVSKLNWERPYGQGKELMCSVTAEPPMNVTWSFRNQSRVSISGWNSARMPVFQSGIYECTVDVDHQRVLGSCGSLFSRVQVEDNHDDVHHGRFNYSINKSRVGQRNTMNVCMYVYQAYRFH